ncbi:MAG TPA: PAS domain S-box protein [Longimicrobiales bacterium]|nr:PAS domain S-box protein [Longimicrobiales bacterium]
MEPLPHASQESDAGHAESGPAAGAAEPRLRAAFDQAFHFMAVLDPEGRVIDLNHAALEAAGITLEDAIDRPFHEGDWWPDEATRTRVREEVMRAAAGATVRLEVEIPGAAGHRATFDLTITPVVDDAGTTAWLVAEARDITEARWAERALRASEARFAGIIAIASDAIISVDENFQITLFNQGAEAIFGHRREDVLGQSLEMLLPERFRGMHAHHMRNFAAAPIASRRMGERQEIMGLRQDGSEFPAEASISKLDLFGSTLFTVVLRDITERKRVERGQRFLAQAGAILASSLDYETTLASVAALTVPELADWCVVYIREADGTVRRLEIAHANPELRPELAELLTYPLNPAGPHPVFTVLETAEPEIMRDVSDEFIESLSQDERHREIYRKLGLRSLMMVPLVARGQTRGAMGFLSATRHRYGADELAVAKDLALLAGMAVDNARLYGDAQAAVRARDDLLAVVSHDLGNPLSAIRIGTSLLLRSLPESELGSGGWQHLEFIRQSVLQMENLISDLLDVKRLEAGPIALELQTLQIAHVVRDVMEVFRPIAQGRSISLTMEVSANLPSIRADYKRLVQVLSNLVSNAVKFTEPGGSVTVSAQQAPGVMLLSVSDTGPGVPEESQPHVFDRFWQAKKGGRQGLGLGLAIARGIVDAHGGRIWLESTPGQGSTFLFAIPRRD